MKQRPKDSDDEHLISIFAIIYIIYDFIKSAVYHCKTHFQETKLFLKKQLKFKDNIKSN